MHDPRFCSPLEKIFSWEKPFKFSHPAGDVTEILAEHRQALQCTVTTSQMKKLQAKHILEKNKNMAVANLTQPALGSGTELSVSRCQSPALCMSTFYPDVKLTKLKERQKHWQ